MKKIFFVLKGYPRVSETFIAQEIYLLQQRGFDIEIVSMRAPRELQRQPIIEKIKAPVTYIPEYINQALGEIIKRNTDTFVQAPLSYLKTLSSSLLQSLRQKSKSPMKRFLQAGWVISKCELLKKDIHLHSHFVHTPTELTLAISQITGIKYSISAHAKDIYTIPPRDVEKRVNNSEFITTCTRFNYDFLKNLAIDDPSKVHLNYHGINTKTFSPSLSHCLARTTPYSFVSVGRLVEKKGYDVIFESLAEIKKKNINFIYDIYGTGDLENELRKKVEDLGLKEVVHFHLTATHPDIIKRFKHKGIYLCGSKITADGDRDGIPNTVAEAMSMELPVVATRVSGIPELVEHMNSGYLIDEKNVEQMTEAICFYLDNPEKAEVISKNARKKVEAFFDSETRVNDLESMFRELVQ